MVHGNSQPRFSLALLLLRFRPTGILFSMNVFRLISYGIAKFINPPIRSSTRIDEHTSRGVGAPTGRGQVGGYRALFRFMDGTLSIGF
jgi:hypothetical protein